MNTIIPHLAEANLSGIFFDENSPFGAIDSNLAAWLPERCPSTLQIQFASEMLEEHMNNQELINYCGGEQAIRESHLFTPQQIRYLAEKTLNESSNHLLQNGFSNLFFVWNDDEQKIYIVGSVFDKKISKFVPYIYRIRNLYRSWSKGNRIFKRIG